MLSSVLSIRIELGTEHHQIAWKNGHFPFSGHEYDPRIQGIHDADRVFHLTFP